MYVLSTVGVVFVGRLVCSVNMLYMELSYTGSLDRSTRASEHVTVQISIPVRLPRWHVFIIIWNGYVLFFMHVVFVGTVGATKKFPFRIRTTTVKRLPPYRDSIVA